jgi:hypothetical protein
MFYLKQLWAVQNVEWNAGRLTSNKLERTLKFFTFRYQRLEFITNLMHNFIYSIIILYHVPQHVSSITVFIFRRTIVYLLPYNAPIKSS